MQRCKFLERLVCRLEIHLSTENETEQRDSTTHLTASWRTWTLDSWFTRPMLCHWANEAQCLYHWSIKKTILLLKFWAFKIKPIYSIYWKANSPPKTNKSNLPLIYLVWLVSRLNGIKKRISFKKPYLLDRLVRHLNHRPMVYMVSTSNSQLTTLHVMNSFAILTS